MTNHTSLPTSVKIMGITYSIKYHDKPSDVDVLKRESLWGQIDFWTRTINIYYREENHALDSIWQVIIHEIVHGIVCQLHLPELNENEDTIDLLALGLLNVSFDNEQHDSPTSVLDLWDNPNIPDADTAAVS